MEIMTVKETAEFLKVKEGTVRNWRDRYKDFKEASFVINPDSIRPDIRFIRSKVEEWILSKCA